MVRAENGGLFLYAGFLQFGIERVRRGEEPAAVGISESAPVAHLAYFRFRMHVLEYCRDASAEGVQYRCHGEGTLTLKNLFPEFRL